MARAFCRLGSNVTLLQAGPRILPQDEPEAGDLIPSRLMDDGVDLRLNAMVDRLWQNGDTIHVGMDGQELEGDALLVAVGRRPMLDHLELDKAGVVYSPSGIQVNSRMRTNRGHSTPPETAPADTSSPTTPLGKASWQCVTRTCP